MESTVSVALADLWHSKDRPYPTYAQYMCAARSFLYLGQAAGRTAASFNFFETNLGVQIK